MKKQGYLWALVALFGLGCGGEAVAPVNKTVGPEGGMVASGDVTVTIPAGAVDAPTEFKISPLAVPPEGAVGPAFVLEPEGTTFKVPVQITLPFDQAQLGGLDASAVVALTAPAGSTAFDAVDAALVDPSHIRVETTHFSQWVAGIRTGTKLVTKLDFPNSIAVDGTNVYWLDSGSATSTNKGRVMKAPVAGGTPVVLAQDLEDPKRLVVAGGYVYFTTGGNGTIKGTVGRVATGGGTVTTLASDLTFPRAIAVDSASVYFSDFNEGTIRKVPLAGGAITSVATGVSKVETIGVASSLLGTTLYVACAGDGTVKKISSTGIVTTLASGQGKPLGLVLASTYVYFTTQIGENDGAVRRVPTAGGTVGTIAASQARPNSIATDGTNLYWVNMGAAALMRSNMNGGGRVVLVGFQPAPYAVAVNGSYAYWVNNGNVPNDGSVMRVIK